MVVACSWHAMGRVPVPRCRVRVRVRGARIWHFYTPVEHAWSVVVVVGVRGEAGCTGVHVMVAGWGSRGAQDAVVLTVGCMGPVGPMGAGVDVPPVSLHVPMLHCPIGQLSCVYQAVVYIVVGISSGHYVLWSVVRGICVIIQVTYSVVTVCIHANFQQLGPMIEPCQ